jgi:hypothetical protein
MTIFLSFGRRRARATARARANARANANANANAGVLRCARNDNLFLMWPEFRLPQKSWLWRMIFSEA